MNKAYNDSLKAGKLMHETIERAFGEKFNNDSIFDNFAEVYENDKKVLGDKNTKELYEAFFSEVEGKKVNLDGLDQLLEIDMSPAQISGITPNSAADSLRKAEAAQLFELTKKQQDNVAAAKARLDALDAAGKLQMQKTADDLLANQNAANARFAAQDANGAAEMAKLPFFTRVYRKLKALFVGIKAGNWKEYLQKGWAWIIDPANLPKVMATGGGALLVILIINALKKRHQLNKYRQLQGVYNQYSSMKEDYEFDDINDENKGLAEVYEASEKNDEIKKLLEEFEDSFNDNIKEDYSAKSNYFRY